jgi:hypothetical protein
LEQITTEYIKGYIKSNEIQLKSTHYKLCIPIIKRMCQKMLIGIKFDDIKICDDLIIDGHHRYLSSLITKSQINSVPGQKTSATKAVDWKDVEFDENDWDTKSKIAYLNEQDARYNEIDIEILRSCLKTVSRNLLYTKFHCR